MKKVFLITLVFIFGALCFIGCKANTDVTESNNGKESGRQSTFLKVENQDNSYTILAIVLQNNNISPIEIRTGESMTFELCNPLYNYNDVVIAITWGTGRETYDIQRTRYVKASFIKGKTTTISIKESDS